MQRHTAIATLTARNVDAVPGTRAKNLFQLKAVDGDVTVAVRRVRELAPPGAKIEVECDSLDQVRAAVQAGADEVLVDNMPVEMIREAVDLSRGKASVEASGGVTLDTVRAIAQTGVDYISVGALTHSPPAMNLALDFD